MGLSLKLLIRLPLNIRLILSSGSVNELTICLRTKWKVTEELVRSVAPWGALCKAIFEQMFYKTLSSKQQYKILVITSGPRWT